MSGLTFTDVATSLKLPPVPRPWPGPFPGNTRAFPRHYHDGELSEHPMISLPGRATGTHRAPSSSLASHWQA